MTQEYDWKKRLQLAADSRARSLERSAATAIVSAGNRASRLRERRKLPRVARGVLNARNVPCWGKDVPVFR